LWLQAELWVTSPIFSTQGKESNWLAQCLLNVSLLLGAIDANRDGSSCDSCIPPIQHVISQI
jgi:hypothetical protein